MIAIDIIAILFIVAGGYIGYKRGAVKAFIQMIGLLAISIVAYQFKDFVATFLIKILPFFNFGGALNELYSLNVLLYNVAAFILMFVILNCLLNILITISGFVDLLVKLTIVLEKPSKYIGAALGAIEALIYVFVISFVLLQFGQTQDLIMKSKVPKAIVERTPVVNTVFSSGIASAENIYYTIKDYQTEKDSQKANLQIVQYLISYSISDATLIQNTIDNGKMHLDNVVVASQ